MDGKKKLRWNAVPTLFNIPNPLKTITCQQKRVHRSPARELDSGKSLNEHSHSKKRVCESATSYIGLGNKMPSCCVVNCTNRTGRKYATNITFHR